jgi:hypothetical protein
MSFDIIAEIDPSVDADLTRLDEQLRALEPLASRLLVPDNHTGRATVSSLVVASQVQARAVRAIACLNARDRNLLGLRRDILTAVWGHHPPTAFARRIGERVPELRPPPHIIDALERDRTAGVRIAQELIDALRDSGAFDGVHLVRGSGLRSAASGVPLPTPAASLRA